MAERNSLWVGQDKIGAADARIGMGALLHGDTGINNPTRTRTGIKPAPSNPGQVLPTGVGGNVTVQPFQGFIHSSHGGFLTGTYICTLDTGITLNLFTDPLYASGTTIYDVYGIQRNAVEYSEANDDFVVTYTKGPSAGVAPTLSGDIIKLARVTVPAGTVNLTAGMVVNFSGTNRPYQVAVGGLLPVHSAAEENALVTYAYKGMQIYRMDTLEYKIYNGTAFKIYAGLDSNHTVTGGSNGIGVKTDFSDFTGQLTMTVTVPSSGKLEVTWSMMAYTAVSTSFDVRAHVALSGANTFNPSLAADSNYCTRFYASSTGAPIVNTTASRLFTGLTYGLTTIKMKVVNNVAATNVLSQWASAKGVA